MSAIMHRPWRFPWPWRLWREWKADVDLAALLLRRELDRTCETNERNQVALNIVRSARTQREKELPRNA